MTWKYFISLFLSVRDKQYLSVFSVQRIKIIVNAYTTFVGTTSTDRVKNNSL